MISRYATYILHVCVYAAASSCKTLHEVSNDPPVLQRVSLDKCHPVAWKQEEKSFLERCTNAENPEALYRTGMVIINLLQA